VLLTALSGPSVVSINPNIRIRVLSSYQRQAYTKAMTLAWFVVRDLREMVRQTTRNDSDTFPDFSSTSICTSSFL
jgi:hypothetical protein